VKPQQNVSGLKVIHFN